ncbi:hypothetical protein H696_06111 [Fonticula alba]|uniref:Uncharacterized protein n=1 Tax=Fonticula alba TaxID=691883 RepID=A0A058YZT5_FONAL|nr:hypothetical protein H696_06111 [Fonticula alba]KCV67470.1 hypothetical protein H696_06111 [Fonticula alba]|eukprot:XP_009498146.1 hypothetical protein H696_06111 [Fonticula alba]
MAPVAPIPATAAWDTRVLAMELLDGRVYLQYADFSISGPVAKHLVTFDLCRASRPGTDVSVIRQSFEHGVTFPMGPGVPLGSLNWLDRVGVPGDALLVADNCALLVDGSTVKVFPFEAREDDLPRQAGGRALEGLPWTGLQVGTRLAVRRNVVFLEPAHQAIGFLMEGNLHFFPHVPPPFPAGAPLQRALFRGTGSQLHVRLDALEVSVEFLSVGRDSTRVEAVSKVSVQQCLLCLGLGAATSRAIGDLVSTGRPHSQQDFRSLEHCGQACFDVWATLADGFFVHCNRVLAIVQGRLLLVELPGEAVEPVPLAEVVLLEGLSAKARLERTTTRGQALLVDPATERAYSIDVGTHIRWPSARPRPALPAYVDSTIARSLYTGEHVVMVDETGRRVILRGFDQDTTRRYYEQPVYLSPMPNASADFCLRPIGRQSRDTSEGPGYGSLLDMRQMLFRHGMAFSLHGTLLVCHKYTFGEQDARLAAFAFALDLGPLPGTLSLAEEGAFAHLLVVLDGMWCLRVYPTEQHVSHRLMPYLPGVWSQSRRALPASGGFATFTGRFFAGITPSWDLEVIYGTGVEPWSQTLDSVSDYVKDEMEYLDRVFPQLGCLNVLALVKGTEVYMLRARHPVQITGVLESSDGHDVIGVFRDRPSWPTVALLTRKTLDIYRKWEKDSSVSFDTRECLGAWQLTDGSLVLQLDDGYLDQVQMSPFRHRSRVVAWRGAKSKPIWVCPWSSLSWVSYESPGCFVFHAVAFTGPGAQCVKRSFKLDVWEYYPKSTTFGVSFLLHDRTLYCAIMYGGRIFLLTEDMIAEAFVDSMRGDLPRHVACHTTTTMSRSQFSMLGVLPQMDGPTPEVVFAMERQRLQCLSVDVLPFSMEDDARLEVLLRMDSP